MIDEEATMMNVPTVAGAGKRWGAAIAALGGGVLALLGGTMLYQRTKGLRQGKLGIKIDKSVTVDELAQPLYRFWRNFENLPRVMSHLAAVTVLDDRRPHWVVKGPAGVRVEWDAEIIHEKPGESIAWRTIDGGDKQAAHVQDRTRDSVLCGVGQWAPEGCDVYRHPETRTVARSWVRPTCRPTRLLAGGQLSRGGADLFTGELPPGRAAAARTRQAASPHQHCAVLRPKSSRSERAPAR